MRRINFLIFLITTLVLVSCSSGKKEALILIKGGPFKNTRSVYYGKQIVVPDFFIGKYEVTQKEWTAVMGTNPSQFKGYTLPVETVSWYDCIEYCNKRSIKEGLQPYYNIDRDNKDSSNTNEMDNEKWIVTINKGADGYRLPTDIEWEYAASGGQSSKNYLYAGSNIIDEVAWYWKNAGDEYLTGNWSWQALVKNHNKTKPVGERLPNELGLYDMSGNVREWCWDWGQRTDSITPPGRSWKGGGWIGAEFCGELNFHASYEASGKGPDQGFRICRSGKAH